MLAFVAFTWLTNESSILNLFPTVTMVSYFVYITKSGLQQIYESEF